MKKIASPCELQAELRSLMAFIQGHGPNGKPDRQVVASKLRSLADRVALAGTLEKLDRSDLDKLERMVRGIFGPKVETKPYPGNGSLALIVGGVLIWDIRGREGTFLIVDHENIDDDYTYYMNKKMAVSDLMRELKNQKAFFDRKGWPQPAY